MLALVLALATACGSGTGEAPDPTPIGDVTGVITQVETRGDEVVAFTLAAEGSTHRILIEPDRDYGFDLAHLEEHRATGDPVLVRTRTRDGEHFALSIEDA